MKRREGPKDDLGGTVADRATGDRIIGRSDVKQDRTGGDRPRTGERNHEGPGERGSGRAYPPEERPGRGDRGIGGDRGKA